MGKSDHNTGSMPSGAPARPSLVNGSASAQPPNILDAMGAASVRKAPAPRKLGAAWLLLPVLALAVWGLLQSGAGAERGVTPVAADSPTRAPAPLAAARPATPTTSVVAAAPAAAEPAPVPPADAPPTEPPRPFAELKTEAPTADAPVHAVAPAAPPLAAAPPKAPPAAAPRQVAKQPAASKSRPIAKTAMAKPPAKQPTSAARPASATNDPDAALIDAILRNLGPSRTPQSIAELARTCQSLDAVDGLTCRRRICEGSWGKAEVCPLSLAPQNVRNSRP